MRLVIQIPCFNEAQTLPQTVADLPREIPGVAEIIVLVIDDGSTDNTLEVARRCGVDHVVRIKNNRGLANAFRTGIDASLKLGADIIVNTDADNQYVGSDISQLVQPLLAGEAEVVIGDRKTASVSHFSKKKKLLQAVGSCVVRKLSNTTIGDAVSGFRAFSREAALQLNVLSSFSYTIETLIQAGKKRLAITSVPIGTNAKTRESRLFRNTPEFIRRSLTTMVRTYAMYEPLRVFVCFSFFLMFVGAVPVVRFLYFFFTGDGDGHVQSLVLGSVLLLMGFLTLMIGLVADLISFNRQLLETALEKIRRLELREEVFSDESQPPARKNLRA